MSGLHDPYLHGKVVLVTGGTGSFGTAFVKTLPAEHEPGSGPSLQPRRAHANDVPRTLALSTDKAVNPVSLDGAIKLAAEKIITQGSAYAGSSPARLRRCATATSSVVAGA
jgi:FlaA1/EpsC-like NDP-sugar epimerase